jgi:hypothetical protein
MKRLFSRFAGIMLTGLLLTSFCAQKTKAQDVTVSYQSFYDELAPYGQWIDDPYYGNVFVPNVAPGFRPYATDGYWAMTDYGNMWMSDEPWAWACYHYGRWTFNEYYGWLWVPGYKWAPAWVSWRSGGGYYGWAPMAPGYKVGGDFAYPENYWVFVTPGYLYSRNVYSYYEPARVHDYYVRTNYYNEAYTSGDTRYYYGPRREDIERETNHPVEVYHIASAREAGASHIGGGNEIQIYRPAINRDTKASARPANVIRGNDHPIERAPQAYSPSHAASPAPFHQEMQNHNGQGRPEGNGGGARPNQQEQQRPQPQEQQRPQPQQQQRPQPQEQQRPQPQSQPMQRPQQQGQPQQQRFQPQQQERPQPQQQQARPQQQERSQPQQQQQVRPQQQQSQPQQQRPQQQGRPQPQQGKAQPKHK